ncbi:hypothetical protein BWI93_10280 [Siphonobacter sp. BAB-5385]|uniref:hypothetical protein n=1 Tax=Siphonobacter sp. BAB-5385 TaxID=1864822 RepID=UPI000B9EC813|nr:hypothetical protein [Siphonobacter sp. BAB-5385]OZI08245.1 hypothetical protein BWI93_10280 [Siphonobacter sp. BAB-5385]
MELNEKATVELGIEGKKGMAELGQLEEKAKALRKELKEIEKDDALGKQSDRWKQTRLELSQMETTIRAVKKEFDLTTATYGQMEKQVRTLSKELKTLTPGSAEFIAKSAELAKVKARFDEVKKEVDGTSKALEESAKKVEAFQKKLLESKDQSLTYAELGQKVDLLKKKLAELPIESQEFIDTTKKLQQTKAVYDEVSKNVSGTTEALTKSAKAAADFEKKLLETEDLKLTFEQIGQKVEVLQKKLGGLAPESQEFIDTSKKLQQTKQYYDNVKKSVDDVTKEINDQIKATKNSELSYGDLKKKVEILNAELKELKPGTEQFIAATKKLAQTQADLGKVEDDVKKISKEFKNGESGIIGYIKTFTTGFKGILAASGILWLLDTIISIGKVIFEDTAKFEKYEAVLTNAFTKPTKSAAEAKVAAQQAAAAAKESMLALQDMAAKTIYGVEELTDGYVKMVNRGIYPTKKEMMAMADLAASQGKTFDQYVEALLDAQTGEMERLKEFGIRGKKAGDDLSFSFKGATTEVKKMGDGFDVVINGKVVKSFKNQEEAVKAAMVSMGQMQGVAGSNAAMMETMSGKVSNMSDGMQALRVIIGDGLKPVFDFFLNLILKGINFIIEMTEKSGPFNAILSEMGVWFGKLGDLVMQLVYTLFPGLQNQTASAGNTMKVLSGVVAILQTALVAIVVTVGTLINAFQLLLSGGEALGKFFTGDFAGATAAWEQVKQRGTNIVKGFTDGFDSVKKAWTGAFVDAPKKVTKDAELAAGQLSDKTQKVISDSEKKAAEKRAKDSLKATQDSIKRTDDLKVKAIEKDLEREKEAEEIRHKRELLRIQNSKASKSQLLKETEAEEELHTRNVEKIKADAQKRQDQLTERWLEDEFVKKIKKAQSFAEGELTIARKSIADKEQLAQMELKIQNWLKTEIDGIRKAQGEDEAKTAINRQKALNEYARLTMEMETDELKRKEKKAELEASYERIKIEKTITDEKEKAAALKILEATLKRDIELIQTEYATRKRDQDANIRKLEYDAQVAQLNSMEALAGNNATKLLAIKKQRLDLDFQYTKKSLDDEQAAEEEKARKSVSDKEVLEQTLTAIQSKYDALRKANQDQSNADIAAAEAEKLEQRRNRFSAFTDAINDLDQGNYTGAIGRIASLFQKDTASLSARAKAAMEYAEQVGAIATAATNFLNNLAQKRADREIAESERVKNQRLADMDAEQKARLQQIETEKAAEMERLEQELLANRLSKAELTDLNNQFTREKERLELDYQAKIKAARDQGNKEEAERLQKERDDKVLTVKENLFQTKLGADESKKVEQELADKKTEINKKYDDQTIDAKEKFEATKKDIEDKAAEEQRAAKLKAWKAQQKADIATAAINGAVAAIKALASGIFPLNLVFMAATIAASAIQIGMIKAQPTPTFAGGGKVHNAGVLEGSRHGSRPGEAGIAMVDRVTGREVGEAEGGEYMYILSRDATKYHQPLLDQLTWQSQNRKLQPINYSVQNRSYRDGGKLNSDGGAYTNYVPVAPFWEKTFALFGSKKRKEAERMKAEAQAEADKAQADADAMMADIGAGGDGGALANSAEAQAMAAQAKEQGELQLKYLNQIASGTETNTRLLEQISGNTGANVAATRGVEGAVYNTNQAGRLDAIIGGISSLSGK